jgi:hypothetical protein
MGEGGGGAYLFIKSLFNFMNLYKLEITGIRRELKQVPVFFVKFLACYDF